MKHGSRDVKTFGLAPGRVIGGKYIVESLLGGGWEGEVYRVREKRTHIARAAKLFFPDRNANDRAAVFYARKLEKLRACPIVLKYHHSETIRWHGQEITALISEYVDGVLLEDMVEANRGKRLAEFEALHVLYELACGIDQVHQKGEYHGDLHAANVIVQRQGVFFRVKLVDLFDLGRPTHAKRQQDITDCIRLLYDMLGGQRRYASQRAEIKFVIGGLKHSLMLKRFPTARRLREHLEEFTWNAT